MAKKIKQFRYFSNINIENNYPSNITHGELTSGEFFSQYMPITSLGIQALPGTKFELNNSGNQIIIGHTGIYEIELEPPTEITSLRFDPLSIIAIENNDNAYLVIDIIHEGESE